MASKSSGCMRNPVSPSTTSSGTPPTRVAIIGIPVAIASMPANEEQSPRVGSTKTSQLWASFTSPSLLASRRCTKTFLVSGTASRVTMWISHPFADVVVAQRTSKSPPLRWKSPPTNRKRVTPSFDLAS
jgi:hypothetical protein